ncbi:MAG: ATP-binding protein [Chloroflexota bacterium]
MLQVFRRLHYKLTLSYTIVTTIVLVVVNFFVSFLAFEQLDQQFVPEQDVPAILAPALAQLPFLLQTSSESTLTSWATVIFNNGAITVENDTTQFVVSMPRLTLLDAQGEVVVEETDSQLTADLPSFAQSTDITRYLTTDIVRIDLPELDTVIIVIPVIESSDIWGYVVVELFGLENTLVAWLPTFFSTLGESLVLSLLIGTLFGYFMSRGLVQRLRQLGDSSEQWAQGQFAVRAHDSVGDEISQLSNNLNQMAQQLEILVEMRQQLGALEERRHIAHELHDTVKQQLFSTNMHLSSLKVALERSPTQANAIVDDLLKLNRQAQHELVILIDALRPAALADVGLVQAIEAYVNDWQKRTSVIVEMAVQHEQALSFVYEHALYRVVQEALNNVEKHANADSVILKIVWSDSQVTITIQDNGQGFDVARQAKTGYGLSTMRERLAKLGGSVEIQSEHDRGTTVIAAIPKEIT